MVLPISAIAGIGQVAGGLIGGRAQKKAAKQVRADAFATASDAVDSARRDDQRRLDLTRNDQKRLQALIAADQGRLQGLITDDRRYAEELAIRDSNRLASSRGYDLVKLREQAIAAGFNPISVLNATGGAGYDMAGSVITTPFVARSGGFMAQSAGFIPELASFDGEADDMWNRANLTTGAGQAVIDTSGYVGRAISSGSSAYVDAAFNQAQAQSDRMIAQAALNNSISAGRATGGQTVGRFPQQGAMVSASPQEAFPREWWKPANLARSIQEMPLWASITSQGQRTVVGEGPDWESQLSAIWMEGTNRAKAKDYIAPDAERAWYEFGTEFVSEAYRVGNWAADFMWPGTRRRLPYQ